MIIRNFINEFILLFTAIKDGLVYIFYEMPSNLFGGIKNKEKNKQTIVNQNVSEAVASGMYAQNLSEFDDKDLKGIIGNQIQKFYDNLPWVKKAREAKEASLKPLVLDPNGADAVRSAENKYIKI